MDSLIFEPRQNPTYIQLNNKKEIEEILGGPYTTFSYHLDGALYNAYCHKEGWRKYKNEVGAVYGTVILTPAHSQSLKRDEREQLLLHGLEFEKWELH